VCLSCLTPFFLTPFFLTPFFRASSDFRPRCGLPRLSATFGGHEGSVGRGGTGGIAAPMKWLRVGAAALAVLAVFVYAAPWIIYGVGLSMIDGRPEPPSEVSLSEQELQELRTRYRLYGPGNVVGITPWEYVIALAGGDQRGLAAKGTVLAWPIAREYNSTHLEQRQWWHPAGAALTIWIMRNWTADQIRAEALEIERRAEVLQKKVHDESASAEQYVAPDAPASGPPALRQDRG
jgi:hypothetical protein